MSSTSEQSENSRTLPRAELNPLLNPVLASHMGRWAEVYFTSPPEKREEAVLELLRELEAEPATPPGVPAGERESIDATKMFQPMHGNGRSAMAVEPLLAPCPRCRHENPVTHQFCGMCGSSLHTESAGRFGTESPYGQHEGEMENQESNPPFHPAQSVSESYVDEPREPIGRSRSDPYDLSLLQGLRQRDVDDYAYEESSSPRYRYYVGAVLVILLVLLGYMAWRSGQMSQSSHQASAAPPSAPAENTPAAQTSSPQANATAPGATTAPPANAPAPSTPTKVQEPVAVNTNTEKSKPAAPEIASRAANGVRQNSAPVAPTATPAGTQPQFAASSGADDLAIAQRYLAGTNGQARNPAEAAKWLWKAMGKHNGPATLQLADLYLKGDGVPKNCEQARVLLDSAALRGMKGAGERLRNLQAFGCQ